MRWRRGYGPSRTGSCLLDGAVFRVVGQRADDESGHAFALNRGGDGLQQHHERRTLIAEAIRATSRIMGLGVVMDVIYQVMVFRTIRPLELVTIVLFLAFLPYLLLRGPINRLLRRNIEK